MTIEIIIEDGSGVANANSYVDVAAARVYAANRGVTLPSDDNEVAALLIKASDYLEAFACKYQGHKTDPAQMLEWPRTCVILNCIEYAVDSIPRQLKDAQSALVIAQNDGLVLQPNITAQDFVTEETVGPLTTKYASPIEAGISSRFTGVDALLAPLFSAACGQSAFALKTIRV